MCFNLIYKWIVGFCGSVIMAYLFWFHLQMDHSLFCGLVQSIEIIVTLVTRCLGMSSQQTVAPLHSKLTRAFDEVCQFAAVRSQQRKLLIFSIFKLSALHSNSDNFLRNKE